MKLISLVSILIFMVACIVLIFSVVQAFIPSSTNNTVSLDLTMIVSAFLVIFGVWLYLREPKTIETH